MVLECGQVQRQEDDSQNYSLVQQEFVDLGMVQSVSSETGVEPCLSRVLCQVGMLQEETQLVPKIIILNFTD